MPCCILEWVGQYDCWAYSHVEAASGGSGWLGEGGLCVVVVVVVVGGWGRRGSRDWYWVVDLLKQTWTERRATSAHTHTPQDKYHTVHRYMDIVTWQEIEGQRVRDFCVCTNERPGQQSHGWERTDGGDGSGKVMGVWGSPSDAYGGACLVGDGGGRRLEKRREEKTLVFILDTSLTDATVCLCCSWLRKIKWEPSKN